MRHFPDTSFFCALYRSQTNSGDADRYMAQVSGPIQTSSLVLLNFRQSIRLQIRLHALDKTKGFSQREGEKMLQDIQADWASGLIETVRVDWPDVHHWAENLSNKHTIASGQRLTDILHVATAMHLAVPEFLTFDTNQKLLARAEGLTVPF